MENNGYDPQTITLPPTHVDTPATRRVRCQYYTDVSHMDEQVGDVLKSLEKNGYADNTLFAFTADQGAQWPFSKWSLYDAGIRTPLLVRWPGRVKGGSSSDVLVSLVDLMPTFIEAAGGKAPQEIDGRSIIPALGGQAAEVHDAVFAAHTGDKEMNQFPMRAIRTKQFKYILNLAPQNTFKTHIDAAGGRDGKMYWESWEKRAKTDPAAAKVVERYRHHPPEELYDIAADPHETKNLADDPAYAKPLDELREKLRAWRIQQGEDLGKVPMPGDARTGQFPYAE
jgi:arylsulfatase A-like enzyme